MFSKKCILVLTVILTLTKICALAETTSLEDLFNIRIVCYYGSWSAYNTGIGKCTPEDIDSQLCTHLIYAFGSITNDATIKPFDEYLDIDLGGYANFTRLKDYNKDLKTLLGLGGWKEGGVKFASIAANSTKKKLFIQNSIEYLRTYNFDGLNLDWQYPYLKDRNNYLALIQELRKEYESESKATGRSRLLLTITLPTLKDHITRGYDVPHLNKYVDWMNVITYDYHFTGEPVVNHHSKLFGVEEDFDYELNANYTINTYISSGAERHKLVLGIPTFGRSFQLSNSSMTDIESPADGPGLPGDKTEEKGYLAYYEICSKIKDDGWIAKQPYPKAMGSYAYKDNQWVGYDDENIVREKSQYAVENKLGGIFFWVLDHDDCSGNCYGKRFPLIKAAKEVLTMSTLLSIKALGYNIENIKSTNTNTTVFAPTEKDEKELTVGEISGKPKTFSRDAEGVDTAKRQIMYMDNKRMSTTFAALPFPIQYITQKPPQTTFHNEMSSITKSINPAFTYLKLPIDLSSRSSDTNIAQNANEDTGKDYVKYFGDDKTLNQFQDFIKGPGGIEKLRAFLNTEETTTPVYGTSPRYEESSQEEILNINFNDNKQIKSKQKKKSSEDRQVDVFKQSETDEIKKSGTLNVVVNINI